MMGCFFRVGYRTHYDEKFRSWGAEGYPTYLDAREHVRNWMKLHPTLEAEFRFDIVTRKPSHQLRFVPPFEGHREVEVAPGS